MEKERRTPQQRTLGSLIFLSRWLQAPLYLGLIVAQAIYVYRFMIELWHLMKIAITPAHSSHAHAVTNGVASVIHTNGVPGLEAAAPAAIKTITEADIMLSVLGLIDVVMIANLLIMVIIGGYETFVSRLRLEGHPDQPEWLSHVNAGVLKVKLATALIGISSIHLLKTFIDVQNFPDKTVIMWQVLIHVTFVGSAVFLAWIERLTVMRLTEKH